MPRSTSILFFLCILLSLSTGSPVAWAQEVPELQVNSERYIVIDAETGQVYAQRGARDEVPIASLTKVFTAVMAVEMAPLDTSIVTEDSDLRDPDGNYFGTNGTLMGFGVGETYSLEDLLYGMLLPSGNDAANAIARALGAQPGDSADEARQRFLDGLNQRIKDAGLTNTNLENAHGWGVEGHHSSAWDVAAFMRYTLQFPVVVDMMGTSSYTTSNGLLSVNNTNRLLSEYGGLIAGKTGFDLDAGYCLVNLAGNGDQRMIAVTLDGIAPGDWYDDSRVLLEYGFVANNETRGGGEFNGDIAAFIDPSNSEIRRSARAGVTVPDSADVLEGEAPVAAAENPDAPAIDAVPTDTAAESAPLTSSIARGTWAVVIAAVALLMLRGFLSFRGTAARGSRRHHVDSDSSDS